MAKYRSPFKNKARMTTPFKKVGKWSAGYHTGEDWVSDDDRTLVAPTSGTVSWVESADNGNSYGNHIVIHTDDKRCILMAHMRDLPCVKKGQKVKAGDKVGIMGNTGNSYGAHLHIEVQDSSSWVYNRNLLKPSDYIDFNNFGNEDEDMEYLRKIANYKGIKLQSNATAAEIYNAIKAFDVDLQKRINEQKNSSAIRKVARYKGVKVSSKASDTEVFNAIKAFDVDLQKRINAAKDTAKKI